MDTEISKHRILGNNFIFISSDGISDFNVLKRFLIQLKNQRGYDDKLNDIIVLNKSQQPIIDEQYKCNVFIRFATSPGFSHVCQMLKRAYNNIEENKELIERIFTLLYRIEFTFDILDESQLVPIIKKYKSHDDVPTEVGNKLIKFYLKNKQMFEDWQQQSKVSKNEKEEKDKKQNYQQKTRSPDRQARRSSPAHKKRYSPERRKSPRRSRSPHSKYDRKDRSSDRDRDRDRERDKERDRDRGRDKKRSKKSRSRSRSDRKERKKQSRSWSRSRDRKVHSQKLSQKKKGHSSRSNERKKNKDVITIKGVGFQKEDNLFKIKCFKKDDPPNAPGLSQEEFFEYQNKLIEQHLDRNVPMEELKTQDRRMEGRNLQQIKDNEKRSREQLNMMKEQIPFNKPKLLNIDLIKQLNYYGIEKENHNKRICEKLSCYYPRTQDIPLDPLPNIILSQFSGEKKQKIIPLTNINDMDFNEILSAMDQTSNNNTGHQEKQSERKKPQKQTKGILKQSAEEKAAKERAKKNDKLKQEEEEKQMKQAMGAESIKKLMSYLASRNEENRHDALPEDIKIIFKAISKTGSLQEIQRKIELIKKIQNDKNEVDKKSKGNKLNKQNPKPSNHKRKGDDESTERDQDNPGKSSHGEPGQQINDQIGGLRNFPRTTTTSSMPGSLKDAGLMNQMAANLKGFPPANLLLGPSALKNPMMLPLLTAPFSTTPIQTGNNIKYETVLSQDEKNNIRASGAQFKTLPCKFYHGRAAACTHNSICTFIHDEVYQGLPHPGYSLESQLQAFTKEQQDQFVRLAKQGIFPPPPLNNKEIKAQQDEFKQAQSMLQQKHSKKQAVQQQQMESMMQNYQTILQEFGQSGAIGGIQGMNPMQAMQGMPNLPGMANMSGGLGGLGTIPGLGIDHSLMLGMGMPQGFQPPPPNTKQSIQPNQMNLMQMQQMMQGNQGFNPLQQ